jgi:hypothetical protein
LIHFVDYKSQAGWKTKSKKHILYWFLFSPNLIYWINFFKWIPISLKF